MEKVLLWLKRAGIVLVVLFGLFGLGEYFETGRLGAIAACETKSDLANCLRQKGYLAQSPFYPDITRRWVAAYARTIGGALGASYKPREATTEDEEEEEEAETKAEEKAGKGSKAAK